MKTNTVSNASPDIEENASWLPMVVIAMGQMLMSFNVFSGEGRNPPTLVGDFNRVEKWKTTKAAAIRDTT